MLDYIILGLFAALGGASIMAMHWAPWHMRLGKEIGPPWTYVIGVSWIVTFIVGWMLLMRPAYPLSVVGVLLISGGIGAGDLFAYWFDGDAKKARWERLDGPKADSTKRD